MLSSLVADEATPSEGPRREEEEAEEEEEEEEEEGRGEGVVRLPSRFHDDVLMGFKVLLLKVRPVMRVREKSEVSRR